MTWAEAPDIAEAQVQPDVHRRHDAQSTMPENELAIEYERQDVVVVDKTVASEGEQDSVDSDVRYAVFSAAVGRYACTPIVN